jgi:hypothetical protein
LPQTSVASHVLVCVYELAHVPATVTSDSRLTVAPLHASLAVGAVKVGVAGQFIVAGAPALPMVGPTLSIRVIVCDTVAE